jgi:hypothetical protein
VAEGDVVDVKQYLVAALAIPDLTAGVARVLQDGAHGALSPSGALAMTIARWIMR